MQTDGRFVGVRPDWKGMKKAVLTAVESLGKEARWLLYLGIISRKVYARSRVSINNAGKLKVFAF